MAWAYDEAASVRVLTRNKRAALRVQARRAASAALANAIDRLVAKGAPDSFKGEQAAAFEKELRDQRRRMVGQRQHCPPVLKPQVEHGVPQWCERLDPEDIAQLANGGWGPHVRAWNGS